MDVEAALRFVEAHAEERPPDRPLTLFHLILRALVRVLDERPRLNRFTAGGRIWQRDGIWITFSAKLRFDDEAPILTVKRRFDPGESLDAMVDRLHDELGEARRGRRGAADREMEWLLALPAPLTSAFVSAFQWADSLGVLPRALLDSSPMHASIFVANLGSVGLDAAYHHLWEHGNIPLFCMIGRIRGARGGRRRVPLKWTLDERVEDGLYCARSLERLDELLRHPERL